VTLARSRPSKSQQKYYCAAQENPDFLADAKILLRRSQRIKNIYDKIVVIMSWSLGAPPDRSAEKGMELSKSVKK
jgi:hypothetical protein